MRNSQINKLWPQLNRDDCTVSVEYLEAYLEDLKALAVKHNVGINNLIALKQALETERGNDLYVKNGNLFDSQIAYIAELINQQNLIPQKAKKTKKNELTWEQAYQLLSDMTPPYSEKDISLRIYCTLKYFLNYREVILTDHEKFFEEEHLEGDDRSKRKVKVIDLQITEERIDRTGKCFHAACPFCDSVMAVCIDTICGDTECEGCGSIFTWVGHETPPIDKYTETFELVSPAQVGG